MKKEMKLGDIVWFLGLIEPHGIDVWIDGGWAVDVLLGEHTRPHNDLDVAIQKKDVQKLRELLEAEGYKDVERDDTSDWNFVLGDKSGHEVDIHVIVLDDRGNGICGAAENGEMYPAASLTGTGTIGERKVKCISAEYMVKFMASWLHKQGEKYAKDISALCEKFDVEYPKEYAEYKKQ